MADPITREQVERAIPESLACHAQGINAVLGALWYQRHDIPEDVIAGWNAIGYRDLTAALTRWRDELAAAEPVRRVARWDADLDAYALTPIHDDGALMTHAAEDAAQAIAWGYEIEGGPEPIDDSSPERLRERREALGWTTAYAGHWVPWFDHTDVERAESGRGIPGFVSRYAAALSAAEAERMTAVGAWAKYGTWEASHLEPTSPPAPEVVDVPQPEPWHVRLVRLAQEAQAASKACAAAEAAFTRADAERETARKERAAAREVCHAKRQALTEATAAAAIIRDAQTGGAS